MDRAMHCITHSHHAVHEAGRCDRQAMVVSWLLRTLGNDRRAVMKLNLSTEVGENSPEGITSMFEDIQISYLFDKYSPASGGFVP